MSFVPMWMKVTIGTIVGTDTQKSVVNTTISQQNVIRMLHNEGGVTLAKYLDDQMWKYGKNLSYKERRGGII